MTDAPLATVIVPTRDRLDHLSACLAAIDEARGADAEVVVVDDASQDPAAVAALAARHGARVVRASGRGPAAARNLGARAARGSVLCFTDDDCRPDPAWVDHLVRRVESGVAAAAGPTRNGRPTDPFAAASQTVTNHLAESTFDDRSGHLGFAPTCNLAVRSEVLAALPFDESYPLAAGEDREWCDRLIAAGHDLVFEPEAWVAHHQRLGWLGFWRQQVRYGRGAHRLRRSAEAGGLQAPRFYMGLVRKGLAQGAAVGGLVLLAQLATAVGIVREAVSARAAARRPSR